MMAIELSVSTDRAAFDEFCSSTWPPGLKSSSSVMWQTTVSEIIDCLESGKFASPQKKHIYVLRKKYVVVQHQLAPGVTKKMLGQGPMEADNPPKFYFAAVEDFWNVISTAHNSVGHLKTRATYHKVRESYLGIPEKAVQKYVELCADCQCGIKPTTSQQRTVKPTVVPIQAKHFMECGQLELLNFSRNPDSGFLWVVHFVDHFTKFSIAWPVRSKYPKEIADGLRERVLSLLGLPSILYTESSISQAIQQVVNDWPGECSVVTGQSRNPESQSCEKHGTRVLKELLKKHQTNHQSKEWVRFLPQVVYQMNNAKRLSTDQTPMQLVFTAQPQSSGYNSDVYIEDNPPEEMAPQRMDNDAWGDDLESMEHSDSA